MTYQLLTGDCRDHMRAMVSRGQRVHSIVTDPPYHLSTVKRFGKPGSAPPVSAGPTGVYKRSAAGFMGKAWDGGDVAFDPETWALCLDMLPPGGHLLAFGGARTYHRMACAIEDAGFEIRDQVMWLYGTGFPKSHNVGKKLDDWQGWGTALKPAHEPIVVARKPLDGTVAQNVLEHGTGAINVDACRVGVGEKRKTTMGGMAHKANPIYGEFADKDRSKPIETTQGRWPSNVVHDGGDEVERLLGEPSRFFYCAKAGKAGRRGSKHPTVKPVALVRWLVRMVTPPGGTVLDPFAGSGTTGEAAHVEGFDSVMMEADEQYARDILDRMRAVPVPRHRVRLQPVAS